MLFGWGCFLYHTYVYISIHIYIFIYVLWCELSVHDIICLYIASCVPLFQLEVFIYMCISSVVQPDFIFLPCILFMFTLMYRFVYLFVCMYLDPFCLIVNIRLYMCGFYMNFGK